MWRRFGGRARLLLWAILALLALSIAACTGSPPAPAAPAKPAAAPTSGPASIDSLIATAKSEQGVVMYGNVPAPFFKSVVAGFNAQYPSITLEYSDLSDSQIFAKYQSEHAQNARTADLLMASAPALWIQAVDAGVIADVTPQGLSNFPDFTRQARGLYVMAADPVIVGFNTKLLSSAEIPTSYADLAAKVTADPAKYKLNTYTIDNNFGYAAIYGLVHILGEDQAWKILDQLGPNSVTYAEGTRGLADLISGATPVGYLGSGLGQVVIPSSSKGLANYGFMQDATPLVPRAIAVTAGAASPASAQLFLDYAFSDAGQQVLCASGLEASANNFVPASDCPAHLAGLRKKVPAETIYLVPIAKDVLDQQPKITKRWNQAFHR
jgi:iron(III) transport system substrate-binding protein